MDIRFNRLPHGYDLNVTFDSGLEADCRINPPDGLVAFVDVLPEVFSLSNALLSQSLAAAQKRGQPVACAKGSNHCCHQLVAVSAHEALLLAHIISLMQPEEKHRILNAFASTVTLLERKALLSEMTASHANAFEDPARIIEAQRRYWQLQIPCPFLESGACSIYAFRPLLCRQYLVSSPPENCALSFLADHLIKRIPISYDLASAAASFDGHAAQPTRAVPLPAILMVNGLLEGFPRPKLPAKTMLTGFLHHVQDNFTRHVVESQ